jgi:tetratricopeptide (TPR) repeat protein
MLPPLVFRNSKFIIGGRRVAPNDPDVLRLNRQEAAVSSRDSLIDLYKWCVEVERKLPLSKAIAKVSARMRKGDDEDQYHLALNLERLLVRAGRRDEALSLMNAMIERYPDDVRVPISKATHYLYFQNDPEEALRWINLALKRAHRTGLFRREVLGNKARILLQLGQGEALSQVLEEIMALQITKGVPDIGRERDFVDRAPPGLIAEDVLARYNEFRPKRAGDSDADEPPEWEHPEDGV